MSDDTRQQLIAAIRQATRGEWIILEYRRDSGAGYALAAVSVRYSSAGDVRWAIESFEAAGSSYHTTYALRDETALLAALGIYADWLDDQGEDVSWLRDDPSQERALSEYAIGAAWLICHGREPKELVRHYHWCVSQRGVIDTHATVPDSVASRLPASGLTVPWTRRECLTRAAALLVAAQAATAALAAGDIAWEVGIPASVS